MHFLVTGHTGFKGTWLSLLLKERGHSVSGLSLDVEPNSIFSQLRNYHWLEDDIRCDMRNPQQLDKALKEINPDVVIHLAAQSLVRKSYLEPMSTFETNVLGTLNILNTLQRFDRLKAGLIVTTDKVYKNTGKRSGYVETDELGGSDPYSASKAMADIATQAWISSFKTAPIAIARAGNVVGGGDVCTDRLIPDLIKSYVGGGSPVLRAPNAVRPWQHVLDCLNGYLILVDTLIEGEATGAWNFGPNGEDYHTVGEVANQAEATWGEPLKWRHQPSEGFHESEILLLNSEKATSELGWKRKLNFQESIEWSIRWYRNVFDGAHPHDEVLRDIHMFEELMR